MLALMSSTKRNVIVRQKAETLLLSSLAVRLLLASSDAQTVDSLSQLVKDSAVHVEVTPSAEPAVSKLCEKVRSSRH
jgi:hypothetical protein